MLITADDALPVFREVKKVREALASYCLSSDKIPVSLDDIERGITEEYNAVLDKKTLPFKSDLVRGFIRIYDPRGAEKLYVQIVIDSELNSALTRHVQTKEMCHIVLHHADNCTADPTFIIEDFVQDTRLQVNGESDNPDTKNEWLADFAAYELLFPHDLREAARTRIAGGQDTIFGTADWLDIPEHVVEYVLADRYYRFATRVWGLIG